MTTQYAIRRHVDDWWYVSPRAWTPFVRDAKTFLSMTAALIEAEIYVHERASDWSVQAVDAREPTCA